MATWSQNMMLPGGRVQTIKIIFTQNRIENLVLIIFGRFADE
jgi:hypothetical protein